MAVIDIAGEIDQPSEKEQGTRRDALRVNRKQVGKKSFGAIPDPTGN